VLGLTVTGTLPSDANGDTASALEPPAFLMSDDIVGRLLSCSVSLVQGETVLFETDVTIAYRDPVDYSHSGTNMIVADYAYPRYAGRSNASVYLDVVMAEPGEKGQRGLHLSIWAGKKVDHIKKANHPLFRLTSTDKITLKLDDMQFEQWGEPGPVAVYLYPYGDDAAAVYMLHYAEYDCAYYALPGAKRVMFGTDTVTLQVPHSRFLDDDPENYWFEEGAGLAPTVRWENIPSPAQDPDGRFWALLVDGTSRAENGEVFQLGLAAVARRK
jgi:hypothetical protein